MRSGAPPLTAFIESALKNAPDEHDDTLPGDVPARVSSACGLLERMGADTP